MDNVKHALIDYFQTLDIIDAHEHLARERDRVAREVDVLVLVSLYAYLDMASAGMAPRENVFARNICLDTSVPLEKRWKQVWPYLQQIKYGTYYRATAIALKDIYGIDDLNEKTYVEATGRMREANTEGLYTRILRERCRIKTCLVQNGRIQGQDPPGLLTPLGEVHGMHELPDMNRVRAWHESANVEVSDLDTYLRVIETRLDGVRKQGAVGIKMNSQAFVTPNMDAARKAYAEALGGAPVQQVLRSTVLDFILRKAGEWDLPVAVHCGVWDDYRKMDPKHMIDVVQRHPDTRFDLYHLGIPYVTDIIIIAKTYHNAYLNLCWCYVISREITRRAINEILDAVPINKVFGFGGDYIWDVENVYGHLVMARETLADVLAERIARGHLDLDAAKHIGKLWLHDNPAAFYRLKL